MRQIKGINDGETSYTYGLSVINEILVFIPRAIFPNRPLPLSEKFVETYYPGVRDMGGGYGFFCLQEGHWAFGIFGIFVFMFFYGKVVQKLYLIFLASDNSLIANFVYSQAYFCLVVVAVRSGIIGNFKALLMNLIPFIIIYFLPKLTFKNSE